MRRVVVGLLLLLFVVACASAPRDASYFKISAPREGIGSPAATDPWFRMWTARFDLYLSGACGEERPVLRNDGLYTPGCGDSVSDLRRRLQEIDATDGFWTIEPISVDEFAAAAAG